MICITTTSKGETTLESFELVEDCKRYMALVLKQDPEAEFKVSGSCFLKEDE